MITLQSSKEGPMKDHKISMSFRQSLDTIPVKRGKGNSENS